jgi:hypothetical protein
VRSCSSLAVSLHARFKQLGDETLPDEVISLKRDALSLTTTDHPDRARLCVNLAGSLYSCFERLGKDSLLYELYDLYEESLQLRPQNHPEQWYALTALSDILARDPCKARVEGAKKLT